MGPQGAAAGIFLALEPCCRRMWRNSIGFHSTACATFYPCDEMTHREVKPRPMKQERLGERYSIVGPALAHTSFSWTALLHLRDTRFTTSATCQLHGTALPGPGPMSEHQHNSQPARQAPRQPTTRNSSFSVEHIRASVSLHVEGRIFMGIAPCYPFSVLTNPCGAMRGWCYRCYCCPGHNALSYLPGSCCCCCCCCTGPTSGCCTTCLFRNGPARLRCNTRTCRTGGAEGVHQIAPMHFLDCYLSNPGKTRSYNTFPCAVNGACYFKDRGCRLWLLSFYDGKMTLLG